MSELWSRSPLAYRGSIPIFSASNEYTDNYEIISNDHLKSLLQSKVNPFIPEELWVQTEESTGRLIGKYSQSGDRILDVGVGLGRLLGQFTDLERHGIDISLGYLQVAQAAGIEVCYSLISDMPYRPGVFDIVVCTDVLEHVLDLNESVRDILHVLKPGGIFITRTPYLEDLSWYLSADCPYRYVHLRSFDQHTLHLLLNRLFNCSLLESLGAGYLPISTRLKYSIPFRGYGFIIGRLMRVLKRIHHSTYLRLMEALYMPVEINHVFRKS